MKNKQKPAVETFMPNNKSLVERSFRKQYLNVLRNHLIKLSRTQKDLICQEIERLADQLAKENDSMVVDRTSRTHLEMTTLV